ncbi:hypothetical protein TcasGA2_TC033683 [Tribolium castaneum]|uniref:Cyclic nucleotide-binding domain-containing protein n=1 Tax=Tribolium castaneum TaxID=7070 RepID=A0A139WEG7_TRICA|nr:hypothetical protein TcasGA2_TC033683 [Tribolium castaneum]
MAGYVEHWYQMISVLLRFLVVGTLEGVLFGLAGRFLVRKMSWNKLSMFSIFFVMPFLCFSFAFNFGSGSGTTGVAILGLILGLERTTLSKEADKHITNFWEAVGFIMDVILCVRCAIASMLYVIEVVSWNHFVTVLVTYLIYYVTRFFCFLLFLPLLSRLGYGMGFKNMIICVWCGIKSPFSVLLVASMATIDKSNLYRHIWLSISFFVIGLYTLSNLINGSLTRSLLNFMGFRTISIARQANMSNCIKHIFDKRERTIEILKMDRFLADSDWALIRETSVIKHPYHVNVNSTAEEEEQYFLGYRYTYCPECKKDVEEQPTAKELNEIRKEAQMRVLKAKKVCYTRQFEKGMVSKPGMRLLSQGLEIELDTGEIYEVNFDHLEKKFSLCIDRYADTKLAFAYDICKSYVSTNSEVLEMLPYLIDNKQVRDEVKMKLDSDRVVITKMLGFIQKEKPWVAITVKTKQAIRTILSNMSEALNQLKVAGWIDNFEQDKLLMAMDVLYERVNAIKMVQPSAPKLIFKEVAWMAEDERVINYLFENVTLKKFDTGDIVFEEGDIADCIYIVVTGLFVVNYTPNKICLENLQAYGRLPIVDYLSSTKYDIPSVDYIVSGNCIGELSFLTERPYNCTIQAEAPSQVFVLKSEFLRRAMKMSPDPVIGLECRIWKEVSIRTAVPLLLATPAYQLLSQEQVKYALERAFVPNLSQYKIFAVTDMIEDVIIVDGFVADYNTRETYLAPCCISRTVQKLILPSSSYMNVSFDVETKLLIIPDQEVDEYDVMMMAEETCEMNTRIPIPYQVFMLASASVWGVIMYYNEVPLLFSKAIDVPMVDVALLYVPAAIFNISFCMDVPIFFKSIPQILIIGLPVAGLTGIFNGILMRQLINDKWPLAFGFFFGLLCIPTNPKFIGYLLKEQSLRTKHIGVLLEGEALISFVLGDYLYLLTVSYMSKHVVHWYQIISVILRFVVMGILEGLLFGMMGRYLVRKMSWNKLSMFSIFFVMPFLCFSFAFNFGSGCGTTGVAILGLIMGLERTTLSREAEKYLTNFWEGLGFIMDVLLCVRCAVDAMIYVVGKVEWSHYVLILVVYLVYYVTRFSCYLLFLPLLSRLGYGMDFKNMMICVWCGIKNPLSLLMVASMAVIDVSRSYDEIWRLCFFFFLGLYTLSNLINGSLTRNLLNFMGFRTISMSRQANMSNCIKHIFNKRQRTIDILKMDRFLADNDWSLIRKICTIEHPYHIDLTTEEEEQLFLGYRYTYCPECKKDVEEQPTAKEIKEIMKEAQMRVLKAKKICYTRQFERGMVSKPGMRLLSQALEVELDTGEIYQVNLDNVEKQFRLNICQRLFRKLLLRIQRLRTSCLRPKTYWRRVCYYLVIKTSYLDILMFVIVILNIVVIGIDWRYHSTFTTDSTHLEPSHKLNYVITTIKLTFIFVYFSEFIIKVMAYSRRSICADGLKRYFKSLANTIDVMIIFILIVNVTFVTNETVNLSHNHERSEEEETVHLVFSWLQLLVIVKLAVVLRIFNPLLLNCLERKADAKMALAYDICKSYAMSNSEVLEMLPYLIDNKQVREEVKMKLNCDRVLITKMLGLIQKEKPWVAITVKTKQAIRTILSNMSEAVNHLRVGGWIDNFEQEKLLLAMDVLYDRVNAIEMVQPSAPKVIFKEVAWMAEDEDVINFLFENVTVKKFDTGDVVFDEGDVADGIYIVVTG